jgi:ATP/maltotriose-dependent transcriptional regulator MalT
MLESFLAIVFANQGRIGEALELARKECKRAEATGLLYLRTEAQRSLAYVEFKRGEFEEAVRLSELILELTADTDARVSRLWAGPVHIEALIALGRHDEAREMLNAYAEMVADCQSPHFTREVARLDALVR